MPKQLSAKHGFVGQDGILPPIENRQSANISQGEGRSSIGGRLPTCPTFLCRLWTLAAKQPCHRLPAFRPDHLLLLATVGRT